MSFTDKKREEIKKYILRKIDNDDQEIVQKTMDNFAISITSVKRYLKEAENMGLIKKSDSRKCGYELTKESFLEEILLEDGIEEDELYEIYIAKHLQNCNDSALRIWQYTCAEMLNNAIEHARGTKIFLEIEVNVLYTRIVITDDGVGIFQTLTEYMKTHGWKNPKLEEALLELYKGKITSKEECHSGEGIFFSSKMMDKFIIWSDSIIYKCGVDIPTDVIQSHIFAYASRLEKIGTMLSMCLENETERKITEVFSMYTNAEGGFVKTSIPIKEACINGEPVARSQARRICQRLDMFKEVILDFKDVEFMGQGFADELFRVYALSNPQVVLSPIHMLPDVERMIYHVARGNMPENVHL